MPKHLETLLTTAGIPADDVAQILAVPEAEQETFDVKPFADKIKTNYQTQLQNDPAFFEGLTPEKLPIDTKKKLENSAFGRASKIVVDKFIKGIGMTDADYQDLPQETKDKIELLIPAIAEKWTKTKSGDKQIQEQLIEARRQLEKYGPDYEQTVASKFENEANQKINNTILRANLIGELSALEGLKIPAADLAKTAEDILLSRYGYERVGDFTIELRQKANPQMKVLKDNSSQELSLREALQQLATERNWIAEEKTESKGSGVVKVEPNKNGQLQMVAPHLRDKISKKIQAEA